MQTHTLLTRLVDTGKRLLPWTLPLKLLVGALLGALGGAGLLGYLSEYATYNYAIHYGFRPPLEGIPYLKATVTLGSFLLLLTGATVFAISILVVRTMLWSLEWMYWPTFRLAKFAPKLVRPSIDFRHVAARLAMRPTWQVFLTACVMALIALVLGYYEAKALNNLALGESFNPRYMAVAVSTYVFLVTLAMVHRKAIWWIAAAATTAYFVGAIIVLFTPGKYATFLRLVGYGGGIPVILEIRDADNAQNYSRANYYLLLRTTEALVLSNRDSSLLIELPRDQIRTISHDNGGLLTLPYKLPATGTDAK